MFKRGVGKNNADYKTQDLFDFYKVYANKPVDRFTYSKIITEFFDEAMFLLIEEAVELIIPGRLGGIVVKSKPYKIKLNEDGEVDKSHLMPDWKKTLALWKKQYPDVDPSEYKNIKNKKLIYHLNEHTNKRRLLWFWDKTTCNVKYQSYYKLDIVRYWDRKLAEINKIKPITYYE